MIEGDLADVGEVLAAVPVAAALAGLVLPVLVFLAINPSGPAAGAWGW